MILPQGSAFELLSKRLACIPQPSGVTVANKKDNEKKSSNSQQPRMDFEELLQHFKSLQEKQNKFRKRRALLRFD